MNIVRLIDGKYGLVALFLSLAFLAVFACVKIDDLVRQNFLQSLRLQTTLEVVEIREELERVVFEHFLTVERVVTAIQVDPELTQVDFAKIVENAGGLTSDIINIAAAPNLIVKYVFPFERNSSVIGLDYRNNATQLPEVLRSMQKHTGTMVGPVDLVQGGRAMIIRRPVPNNPNETAASDDTWGMVSLVFDLDEVMVGAKLEEHFQRFDVYIAQGETGSSTNQVVLGDRRIKADNPVELEFDFPNGNWEFSAIPKGGWPDNAPSYIQNRLLMGLAVILILSGVGRLMYLTASRRNAQRRLNSAINAMDGGFAMFDSDGALIKCNHMFKEIYQSVADILEPGIQFEKLVRTRVLRGQVPEAIGKEEEWIKERMLKFNKSSHIVEQKLSNGRVLKASDFRTEDGVTVLLRADVTELSLARERAEFANRAKTEFMNILSHELRTPLTVILGFSGLSKNIRKLDVGKSLIAAINECPLDREILSNRLDKLFEHIVHAAERQDKTGNHLLNLINEMLDFAKIESGKLTIEKASYEVEEVALPVSEQLRQSAEAKGLNFTCSIEPGKVTADVMRVRQILFNLAGNAIKFTEKGEVSITIRRAGAQILFEVQDTGPGIPADQIERIFKPFEQLDSTDTRSKLGTGLGLAISRKLAEAQGGSLSLISELGKGSTFTLALPS